MKSVNIKKKKKNVVWEVEVINVNINSLPSISTKKKRKKKKRKSQHYIPDKKLMKLLTGIQTSHYSLKIMFKI